MGELMTLPIDQITFEDVVAFCAPQTREHMRLEYKERFSSKHAGKQIAKEVAAFANTQGGMLIFGVEEEGDRRPVKHPQGADLGSNPRQTVQTPCTHEIYPPVVPEVSEFLRNPENPSHGFLVVQVGASEEVHATDDGSGIYIRVNDQSEPIRPTVDRLEWLFQRRSRAVALQASRREGARDQLKRAIYKEGPIGSIEVSIGPRISEEPLIDLDGLRTEGPNFSVESRHFSGMRAPIQSTHSMKAAANALYSLNRFSHSANNFAGMIDVFGNITLVAHLARPQEIDADDLGEEDATRLPKLGGSYYGMDVGSVVERILCAIRVAANMYRKTEFVGLIEITFHASNVRGFPLVFSQGYLTRIMGTCPLYDHVCVQDTLTTYDLSADHVEVLEGFVKRILWAWGDLHEESPKRVIDLAEQYHYGSGRCECKRKFPLNRKKCLTCRLDG